VEPLADAASGARAAWRRTLLMVTVLDGIDLEPADAGVQVTGPDSSLLMRWDEVGRALAEVTPETLEARVRLRTWLRLRLALAAREQPQSLARPMGLPVGHVLHPGPGWVQARILGGALDVGIGLLGLLDDPDEVVVPPEGLLAAAGLDDRRWWPQAMRYLDDMARVAAGRLSAESRSPLRPIGDCDVVTLLASPYFRASLCDQDRLCIRTAAVPMRRRGWLDLDRIDPAFAVAAAAATDVVDRGFDRPVLITCEEVTLAQSGGRPQLLALSDPVSPTDPWDRR
jgi:hypothetical protein